MQTNPDSSITLRGTPALAAAIRKWMETRRPGGGFPSVWYISIWSRLARRRPGEHSVEGRATRVGGAPQRRRRPVKVRYGAKTTELTLEPGRAVRLDTNLTPAE